MRYCVGAVRATLVGVLFLTACSIDPAGINVPSVTGAGGSGGDIMSGGAGGGQGGAGGSGRGGSSGQGGVSPATGGSGGGGGLVGGDSGGWGGADANGGAGGESDTGVETAGPDQPTMLGIGALCSADDACASHSCVDGVCCESACAASCMACASVKTGQLDGECRTVKMGTDPDSECDAEPNNACGRTGRCGIGMCEMVTAGKTCNEAVCSGRELTAASICDGSGQCMPGATTRCANLFKCGNARACATKCTSDNDCFGVSHCDLADGKCKPGLSLGSSCTPATANECLSGQCVDGVCCESACTGDCRGCSMAKTGVKDGQCAPARAGSDPDEDCAKQDASTCGRTGVCDGAGACRVYADGTACGTTCCDEGPGRGARPCNYACRAGVCDRTNPIPGSDMCTGQQCCCPNGGGTGQAACVSGLLCGITGCR